MEGAPTPVPRKGKVEAYLERTPYLITCNTWPWCRFLDDVHVRAFRNCCLIYRVDKCEALAEFAEEGELNPEARLKIMKEFEENAPIEIPEVDMSDKDLIDAVAAIDDIMGDFSERKNKFDSVLENIDDTTPIVSEYPKDGPLQYDLSQAQLASSCEISTTSASPQSVKYNVKRKCRDKLMEEHDLDFNPARGKVSYHCAPCPYGRKCPWWIEKDGNIVDEQLCQDCAKELVESASLVHNPPTPPPLGSLKVSGKPLHFETRLDLKTRLNSKPLQSRLDFETRLYGEPLQSSLVSVREKHVSIFENRDSFTLVNYQ